MKNDKYKSNHHLNNEAMCQIPKMATLEQMLVAP